MTILNATSGTSYATVSDAINAASPGDVIQLTPGTYSEDFPVISNLTIEGVGGLARLTPTLTIDPQPGDPVYQPPANAKAVLVTQGAVTLDHLEITGAAVSDADGANGAGIRYESGSLTITNSHVFGNQEGLLAGANPGANISIDRSEFDNNGAENGLTHNIYAGEIGTLTITNSYIHDALGGHEIKSRAANTIITGTRIQDGLADSSYLVDLPEGGVGVLANDVLANGPNAQNYAGVHFGGEAFPVLDPSSLTLEGITYVNLIDPMVTGGWNPVVLDQSDPYTVPTITGSTFYGVTSDQMLTDAGGSEIPGDAYATPAAGNSFQAADAAPVFDTSSPIAGGSQPVILLTTAKDTITGPGNDILIALPNTLTRGDSIDGGSGTNRLALYGGGTFDLATPAKLAHVQVVSAQEGEGGTAQTVILRAHLNATVNVSADTRADASPGITIMGAAGSDTINLGAGANTVTPGSGETVNGGSGSDTYIVTAATIGAVTINGGGSSDALVVNGGGVAVMGSKLHGLDTVQLATTTRLTANTTAGLRISGSSAGSDVITLGASSQSVISGGANETIKAKAVNAGAAVSGLGANSQLEVSTGGLIRLNAATAVSTVKLDVHGNLLLNSMSFMTAIGSSGSDTLQAGATGQTLTGGAGADKLVGYAGGHDTFKDTAAGLYDDTIKGFLPTDQIDITDLSRTGATLTTTAMGSYTSVHVVSGSSSTTFLMAGSFNQSRFTLAPDAGSGTMMTYA